MLHKSKQEAPFAQNKPLESAQVCVSHDACLFPMRGRFEEQAKPLGANYSERKTMLIHPSPLISVCFQPVRGKGICACVCVCV